MSDNKITTGACLCGAVKYRATGKLRPVLNCHCRQCARWTGNSVMATASRNEDLEIDDETTLSWYKSSDWGQRGFCNQCGSSLFWRMPDSGVTSIMAGTIDKPTGLKIAAHVFVEDKGDYDIIGDDAPCLGREDLTKLNEIFGDF